MWIFTLKKLLNSKDIDIFHDYIAGLDLYFYKKHFGLAYFNLQTWSKIGLM